MTDDNPYESPEASETCDPKPAKEAEAGSLTGRQAYNVVSDTVTGANLRLKDNVIQALAIGVCLILGAGIGALVVEEGTGVGVIWARSNRTDGRAWAVDLPPEITDEEQRVSLSDPAAQAPVDPGRCTG